MKSGLPLAAFGGLIASFLVGFHFPHSQSIASTTDNPTATEQVKTVSKLAERTSGKASSDSQKTFATEVSIALEAQASITSGSFSAQLPDFSQIADVTQKKEEFFAYLLPKVQKSNQKILAERNWLLKLQRKALSEINQQDLGRLMMLAKKYKADTTKPSNLIAELLRKVDIIPPSLAMAQAANESAWGTSRFAIKANNLFGQWCYSEGCGLIPKQRGEGKKHEVAKFKSIQASVDSYMRNLNSLHSYKNLRAIRDQMRKQGEEVNGLKLAKGLLPYSTRREEYVKEIRSMIHQNNLDVHDG